LPLAPSTLNVARVLPVRLSHVKENLPFGVRCRSEAQMSLSVLRGGGTRRVHRPGPRGAPGTSLESGGKPDIELTSVNSPVLFVERERRKPCRSSR